MPCSATAALIHKRVTRLQAVVRGRQTRRRVLGAVRRDYRSICEHINGVAFGAEPPYQELADLGFFDGNEWEGASRPPGMALPQLLPHPPPQHREDNGTVVGTTTATATASEAAEPAAAAATAPTAAAAAAPTAAAAAPRRSRDEILAELASVRRAIQERIEFLQQEHEPQGKQLVQEPSTLTAAATAAAAETADQ